MTPKEAIAIVKAYTKDPDITIASCKNYKTDYLITAFKTPEDIDPFYLVNKTDGFVRRYTIAEDLVRYYDTPEVKIR